MTAELTQALRDLREAFRAEDSEGVREAYKQIVYLGGFRAALDAMDEGSQK